MIVIILITLIYLSCDYCENACANPLNLIIIIKSIWLISYCVGLGHETMVGTVCLVMFLSELVTFRICDVHVWRHDLWLASICDCGTICDHIMLQFVTRHDLWPKVLQFVTSVIQWFYSPSCAGGKLVFVFTLIMYTKWYNMIIYIYMNYDIILI